MKTVGVAPGTTTVQMGDGTTIALADWIDDKLYGSVEFTNADSTELEVFSNGRSQNIPGGSRNQTRVDTNLPRQGGVGLPKDWEMLIYGWGVFFTRITNGATLATYSEPLDQRSMFEMDRVCSMSFTYNGKKYTEGTPLDYPAGKGIYLQTTDTARDHAHNGVPSPRDRQALTIPVHMRENLGFVSTITPEAAISNVSQTAIYSAGESAMTIVDVKVACYGMIKRTVV